jgi:SEC-C motif
MKPIIITLLLIFGVIIIVGLGSVLLVLWAYGAGQVMLRILPAGTFSSFEATLLNQVGVLIVGLMVMRIISAATTNKPLVSPVKKNVGDYKESDEEDKDKKIESEEDEYTGIPRWRRPLKKIDFTDVKPNDLCPCGSGRKFKSCHGYKQAEVK